MPIFQPSMTKSSSLSVVACVVAYRQRHVINIWSVPPPPPPPGSDRLATLCFHACCSFFMAESSWQPVMGAAQRRRQRRLRSWWRHEQQSIAAALAAVMHHSSGKVHTANGAPRSQKLATRVVEEVEYEPHCALRGQKTPPPGAAGTSV